MGGHCHLMVAQCYLPSNREKSPGASLASYQGRDAKTLCKILRPLSSSMDSAVTDAIKEIEELIRL